MSIPRDAIGSLINYFQNYEEHIKRKTQLSSEVCSPDDLSRWNHDLDWEPIYSRIKFIYHSHAFIFDSISETKGTHQLSIEVDGKTVKLLKKGHVEIQRFKAHCVPTSSPFVFDMGSEMECSFGDIVNSIRSCLGLVEEFICKSSTCYVVETGGTLDIKIDSTCTATVFVSLATEFTGGEFIIKIDKEFHTHHNKTNQLTWLAVFGNYEMKAFSVTSGTQVILVLSLELKPVEDVYRCHYYSSSTAEYGPFDHKLQNHHIQQLCTEMDGLSLGILLSDEYNSGDYDTLFGTDMCLVAALRKAGCVVRLYEALYRRIIPPYEFADHLPKCAVFICTRKHLGYALNEQKNPPKKIHVRPVPFFDLDHNNHPPVFTKDICDGELWVERVNMSYYLVPALIIRFPTWWTRARLLWIAKIKNDPQECLVARLPAEVIYHITNIVKADSVTSRQLLKLEQEESKKRKREE